MEETGKEPEQGLDAALRSSLRRVDDVAFAYLFGSAVKGAERSDSDVDVAIHTGGGTTGSATGPDRLGEELTAEERVAVAERAQELGAMLQKALERPVQVVALELAPHDLVHNVLRHGRLLACRDDRLRSRFYVAHARRHFDLVAARRIFDRYRQRRIQEGTFGGRSRDGS